jgi:hypothetical protein
MSKVHVVSLGDSAKERETREKVRTLVDSGMLSELRDVFNQYEKQCDTK